MTQNSKVLATTELTNTLSEYRTFKYAWNERLRDCLDSEMYEALDLYLKQGMERNNRYLEKIEALIKEAR